MKPTRHTIKTFGLHLVLGALLAIVALTSAAPRTQAFGFPSGLIDSIAVNISGIDVLLGRISGYRVAGPDVCESVHIHGTLIIDRPYDFTSGPASITVADPNPSGCGHGGFTSVATRSSMPLYGATMLKEAPINAATKPGAGGSSGGGLGAMHVVPDPCPKKQDCKISIGQDAGDPVYLHTGEFYVYETDLRIPSRGFSWELTRKYRSGIEFSGPLGFGWDFNYDRRLTVVSSTTLATIPFSRFIAQPKAGDVVRMDGTGRVDYYVSQTDGTFTSPAGFYINFTKQSDGTYVERDTFGNQAIYGPIKVGETGGLVQLTALKDRNGNTMTFEYNSSDQLVKVLDTMGRPITYAYDSNGLLTTVTDFTGRTVTYKYDSKSDLIEVTTPAVTGTSNGNDFPNGKTTRYTYSTGFNDSRSNHNLLTITAPNEVANGGPPRLQVTYETAIFNSDHMDRVLSLQQGGTNASGVPSGGTISYSYSILSVSTTTALNTNDAVFQTTVTDRNGNQTEYQFNNLGNIVKQRELTNRNIRSADPTAYETTSVYNDDGELVKTVYPEGNSLEFDYDDSNPDRLQQGNVQVETRRADTDRGGDQTFLTTATTFEPLYGMPKTETEPRGNDPTFVPQNGGATSTVRYTARYTYDYEESCNFNAIGGAVGRSATSVQAMLTGAGICASPLGDVNGDGITNQVSGNTIKVERPRVRLLAGSKQALAEATTTQPIIELFTYNKFGLLISRTDPMGHVDTFDYHPENDPDGDGNDQTSGVSSGAFGYLKESIKDATGPQLKADLNADGVINIADLKLVSDSLGTSDTTADVDNSGLVDAADLVLVSSFFGDSRNRHTIQIRGQYFYDRVGNITRIVDGRGVATDFKVNQWNQTITETRGAANSIFAPDPAEPLTLTDFQYVTRYFYDANDNLVMAQVEDRGNTSGVDGNLALSDLPSTTTDPDPIGGTAYADTVYKFDILDQVVESVQEVVNGSTTTILRTRHRYDKNENRVLTILPEGNAIANVYDERDLLFQSIRGATGTPILINSHASDPTTFSPRGGNRSIRTYNYDLNGNSVEIVDAEDTDNSSNNGSDVSGAGDRTREIYDGFDRPVSQIDAVGNQTVYQYDPASNIVRISSFGPVGGSSPTADGPDTLSMPVSSSGTIQSSNLVNSTLLSSSEMLYDELSRVFQSDVVLFINSTSTARTPDLQDGASDIGKSDLTPSDNQAIPGVSGVTILGRITTRTEYDRDSRRTFVLEDDGDVTRFEYDGVDRLIRTIDPERNIIEYAYDDNGNIIETRETDVSQVLGVASEMFVTTRYHDSLNRVIRVVNNLGQTTDTRYDSRDNPVAYSDAEGPDGPTLARRAFQHAIRTLNTTNLFGNVTTYAYDGINRKLNEERVLTASGKGDGANIGTDVFGVKSTLPAPDTSQAGGDGKITVRYQWDDNSLLSNTTDDNGNQVQYTYDNLNRRISQSNGNCVAPSLADRCDSATSISFVYDQDHNVTQATDENGSVRTCQFDAVNRTTSCSIARASGVIGTTVETYQYDGLSRKTVLTDNNDPAIPGDDSTVRYIYDSISRIVEESQQTGTSTPLVVSSNWRAANLRSGVSYANDRAIDFTYDDLDRLNIIRDQGASKSLADYDYIGRSRVLKRTYPLNGTAMTYIAPDGVAQIGYDGLRRTVQLSHVRSDNELLVGFTHQYDRRNNRLTESKTHAQSESELYEYDSTNRLTGFERGTLNPANDAITSLSVNVPIQRDWKLDGVGNWQQVDGENRQHSSFNEIVSRNSGATSTVQSDDNGNTTDNGTLTLQYDSKNRLRTVTRKSDSKLIATYAYDFANRRIFKSVSNSGSLDGTTRFIYDGMRAVEERNGVNSVTQQYVYGHQVDQPIVMDRNLDGNSSATDTADSRLFYHQNSLDSVHALTDITGNLVEGYQYDGYGSQTVFAAGANSNIDFGGDDVVSSGGASQQQNPYLFTGRRLDPETGLFYYRSRYLDPALGRFIHRDPIGIWGDSVNLGNAYAYAGNNPTNKIDPMGRDTWVHSTDGHSEILVALRAKKCCPDEMDADGCCPVVGYRRMSYGPTTGGWDDMLGALYCPGALLVDEVKKTITDEDKKNKDYIRINTSCKTEAKMLNYGAGVKKSPGDYNPFTNSCVDFVQDTLESGGLSGVPGAGTQMPGGLRDDLNRNPPQDPTHTGPNLDPSDPEGPAFQPYGPNSGQA